MNSLVPISRLPQELLVKIFHQLGNITGRTEGSLKWTVVSHVCRYWRESALQHPRLWDHFVFNFDRPATIAWTLLPEHLSRARQIPVVLKISSSIYLPFIPAFQILISSVRIPVRILKLKLPAWKADRPELPKINTHLVELSCSTWTPLISPDTEFPVLERINIRNVQYESIHLFLKPRLTRIELSYCDLHDQDINSFLSALDNMPRLSALSLTCVAWSTPPSTKIPHITLSHLHLLTVHCRDDLSHAQILDHLTIPSAADLRLDILVLDESHSAQLSVATFVQSLSSLVRRCSIGEDTPMLTGSLSSHCHTKGYRVAAWSQRMELKDMPPQGDPPDSRPKVIVSMYSPRLEEDQAFQMICRALALTRIQVLTINRVGVEVTSSWARVLGGFDEVQVLRVVDPDHTPHLCRALGKLPHYSSDPTEKGSPQVLLPRLENLILSGITFRHSYFPSNLMIVRHFGHCFELRVKVGNKIPFVTFRNAINLEYEDVALFEKFVGQVIQQEDGKTGKENAAYYLGFDEDDR